MMMISWMKLAVLNYEQEFAEEIRLNQFRLFLTGGLK
jgi:hypothetical protein